MRRFSLVATVLALLLVAAACGNGDEEAEPTTTTQPPTTTTTAPPQPDDPEAARAEVTSAFETFLDANAPDEERAALVQDAEEIAEALAAAGEAQPEGVSGEVDNITFTSPTEADVVFTILINGQPALPNFPGTAVLVDDMWKVSRTTACDLAAQSGATCPT